MMTETIDNIRKYVTNLYPNSTKWKNKVKRMSDQQVYAIWVFYENDRQRKIKIARETKAKNGYVYVPKEPEPEENLSSTNKDDGQQLTMDI